MSLTSFADSRCRHRTNKFRNASSNAPYSCCICEAIQKWSSAATISDSREQRLILSIAYLFLASFHSICRAFTAISATNAAAEKGGANLEVWKRMWWPLMMTTIPFVRSIFEKIRKNWKLLKKLPLVTVVSACNKASGWRNKRDADQATADVS